MMTGNGSTPALNRILVRLLALLLGGALVLSAAAQQPKPETPAPPVEKTDAQKRQESFEIVWNTVNERFYDPKFGGLDWNKVRERYAPLISQARNDQEFHRLLQQMLAELHQSHFVIIPKESIPKLSPRHKAVDGDDVADNDQPEDLAALENDEATTPLDRIGYKLTDRMSSGIGIDLRVMKGSAVITRVEPASVAARAGLRPGFVIKTVAGESMDKVIAQFQSNPSFQSIFRGEMPVILLAAFINGERQSPLSLVYLDGRNRERAARLKREKLKGEMSPAIGNLPALYTEFESRQLPGGYGYIRFNAFVPSLMKKICAALRTQHEARGLILDLRGNQGGLLGMLGGLTGLLEDRPVALGIMQTRTGRTPVVAFPQRASYAGPLVIMIDSATQSAAEMFASGMQETGRAVVVGEQSAGNTLPSSIMKLPTGALFQYGFANYETLAGNSLEGHGIRPDVSVPLNRRALLLGADPQMAAALRKVRELARSMTPNGPRELIADVSPPPRLEIKTAKPAPVTVVIGDAPEPPPPAKAPKVLATPPLPSVDEIVDHYVRTIGGQEALEKLTSRVSLGTVELQSMGLNGTAEIYEQAPNKSTLIINVEGLGTIQQTFDGVNAWLQDPLEGYIKFAPAAVAKIENQSDFHRELHLRKLNPGLIVIGKEKLGNSEAFVLQSLSSPGAGEKWYFDTTTGLLLRKGNISYDDYREVDGVKLPFKVTDDSSYGFGVVVRLSEIKHNVAIDQSKFVEYPDCFTKPGENWREQEK
jgi:carboxyl-terminal processing protease